ncbi:MAG: RloB family protein [Chitinophagales bacterium]
MARRKNRRDRNSGKKTYSIVVDGETEVWYFQMLKQFESLPTKVDIKPELAKKKALKGQYDTIVENIEKGYDKVIWVLDFDTVVKESKDTKKGQKSKIQEFREYAEQLEKYPNVYVLINNPCLEFWYLLHFESTSKYYSKCDDAGKELKKKYLADYEKSQKYYKKRDNDIYSQLKPHQKTAVENAQKLGDFDFEDPESAKAEIYKIFELLGIE